MSSPLTQEPSTPCPGEWPLVRSCSMDTLSDDNGPYLTSPQYREPLSSPLPGNSVKLVDGRTITITWHLSPTVRRRERHEELKKVHSLQVCSDDIPSPAPPSLLQKFINAFLQIPPQVFQRPWIKTKKNQKKIKRKTKKEFFFFLNG